MNTKEIKKKQKTWNGNAKKQYKNKSWWKTKETITTILLNTKQIIKTTRKIRNRNYKKPTTIIHT